MYCALHRCRIMPFIKKYPEYQGSMSSIFKIIHQVYELNIMQLKIIVLELKYWIANDIFVINFDSLKPFKSTSNAKSC